MDVRLCIYAIYMFDVLRMYMYTWNLCLSICMYVLLSDCLSIYTSICLHMYVRLRVCSTCSLIVSPSPCLSALPVRTYVLLGVCPSGCMSFWVHALLSVCPFVSLIVISFSARLVDFNAMAESGLRALTHGIKIY